MAVSADQKQFYDDNGYLVVENVIDDATLSHLRHTIAEFKKQAAQVAESNSLFDVGPGHTPETPKLRRLKDPHVRHPAFWDVARSDAIVDIVAGLLGGTARFDHSKLNFKPVDGGEIIHWHQDWAFYPHTNDGLLAVGIMIEDCTPENGPLQVIPGSHKGPVYDHHQDGLFVGGIRSEALASELDEAISLTAKAGSVSVHHVRTLHASSKNVLDRERPLLLFSYSAVDAFPVATAIDLAEYDSLILRGEPTLEPRNETLPMRLPMPRMAHDDSIYDNQSRLDVANRG